MQRTGFLATLVLLSALIQGCAAQRQQARLDRAIDAAIASGTAEHLEFDPIIIQSSVREDGTVVSATTDLNALFEEATAYYRAKDYPNAVRLYDRVLEYTDDPLWIRPTMFNRGLSFEGAEDWEDAAADFAEVIRRWPTSRDARDAYFRLAEAYAWIGAFQDIPPLMRSALQRVDLNVDKRIEALVRSGTAYFEMRQFEAAERDFNAAIQLDEVDRQARLDEGRSSIRSNFANGALAQANFILGRIYHEIFSEIRMVLPVERYREDLADKDRLYHQAVEWYTRTVRTGDVDWTVQAGYMLGKINEDYYLDILASEVPSTFGEAELAHYWPAMRDYLAPGLRKASRMYELALGMAYRMGSTSPLIDEMIAAMARIERYLETQEGWEDEHKLIVEGRHPHSPDLLRGTVFRHEVSTIIRPRPTGSQEPSRVEGQ